MYAEKKRRFIHPQSPILDFFPLPSRHLWRLVHLPVTPLRRQFSHVVVGLGLIAVGRILLHKGRWRITILLVRRRRVTILLMRGRAHGLHGRVVEGRRALGRRDGKLWACRRLHRVDVGGHGRLDHAVAGVVETSRAPWCGGHVGAGRLHLVRIRRVDRRRRETWCRRWAWSWRRCVLLLLADKEESAEGDQGDEG
jgi:hypothetical protein